MSQTCPNCGFENRATNRFCSNCGDSLVPPVPGSPEPGAGAPAAGTEPVTYKVQTWDASEQPAEPAEEEKVVAPPRPTFLPYGAFSSATPGSQTGGYGMSTGAPTAPVTSVAPPPVSPSGTGGGTYAPYSPEVARKLEAQKPERSWLLPSVGAAAILLLVLIAVGGYLLLAPKNGSGSTDSSSATSGQSAPPASGSDADTIKNVIKQSNDEQITAWRNLDTDVLKGTRTGQVLQDNIQAVQDLKNSNMYAVPVNKSLQFGEINVNGDTATAKTVEVWTVTFYSKDGNKVVNSTGPDTLYETYHLVKQDGKWLVSTLDIVQNPLPALPALPAQITTRSSTGSPQHKTRKGVAVSDPFSRLLATQSLLLVMRRNRRRCTSHSPEQPPT